MSRPEQRPRAGRTLAALATSKAGAREAAREAARAAEAAADAAFPVAPGVEAAPPPAPKPPPPPPYCPFNPRDRVRSRHNGLRGVVAGVDRRTGEVDVDWQLRGGRRGGPPRPSRATVPASSLVFEPGSPRHAADPLESVGRGRR